MQNFFITGANGWLGRKLVEYLLEQKNHLNVAPQNINVFCLATDDASVLKQIGVNIFFGDIREVESVQNFLKQSAGAVVIHLSGIIHPKIRTSDFFDVNYLGAKHVVESCAKFGAKKLVLMSSNSPLGCNKSNQDEDIFTEDSPFNPYMKYGQSKFLMEQFAQEFMRHNHTPKITIIRAPWFYGPYQPQRQTTFFEMIRDGKFPIVGAGNNKRSMVYTENLAQGIVLAALKEKADGQTYWIADSAPYTMKEIVLIVREVMEKEFNIKCKNTSIKLPSIISDLAFIADSILQKSGLYQQKIHVLSEMNKNIFCSIKKAQDDLGYSPQFILYGGMKESIGWCISQQFLTK